MIMRNHKLATLTLVSALVIATGLTGCGNRLPASAPVDEQPVATEPAAEPPTPDVPAPSVPPTGNPGYEQPVLTGSLVVSSVDKKKKGLLFKKLVVSGQVVNTSNQPLSDTLKIEFKKSKGVISKKLEISETKTQVITQLAPGQSVAFSLESDKSGTDDAEVTVETTQPVAAAGAGFAAGGLHGQAGVAYPQAARTGPYGY